MKKLLIVSALATTAGLMSGLVGAQELGKVISSTPVLKRVTEPKSTCTNDADGRQRCVTQMVTEDRQIGFKVVYEYAGRQHQVQLPFAPGPTIELDVVPTAAGSTFAPSDQPQAYSGQPTTVVERVVREPVYVEPAYYPSRYYYSPGYYYDPLFPIVGLALGYTFGSWGHAGWRGGYRGGGHWHR